MGWNGFKIHGEVMKLNIDEDDLRKRGFTHLVHTRVGMRKASSEREAEMIARAHGKSSRVMEIGGAMPTLEEHKSQYPDTILLARIEMEKIKRANELGRAQQQGAEALQSCTFAGNVFVPAGAQGARCHSADYLGGTALGALTGRPLGWH